MADIPSQLYFRRCYGGNSSGGGSELIEKVGLFSNIVNNYSAFLTAPPPVLPERGCAATANLPPLVPGYLPRGVSVAPAKTTRAALWQLPNCTAFCGLLVVVNLSPAQNTTLPPGPPITVTLNATSVLASYPSAAGASAVCLDCAPEFTPSSSKFLGAWCQPSKTGHPVSSNYVVRSVEPFDCVIFEEGAKSANRVCGLQVER